MNYELDDLDMRRCLPGVRVIRYPELTQYSRIEDALDPEGRLVILFLTEGPTVGHWVCVHGNFEDRTLEFFDSYGLKPDDERNWMSHSRLVQLNETEPLLYDLLADAAMRGWKITFNPYHLQSTAPGVETCGRHVVTRLLNQDADIHEYVDGIEGSGFTPDQYVLKVTRSILHK